MEDKRLWCRNCNEIVTHRYLGKRPIRKQPAHRPAFLPPKMEKVYACNICNCEVGV